MKRKVEEKPAFSCASQAEIARLKRGWAGTCPGALSPTASMRISAWMNGTARTCSFTNPGDDAMGGTWSYPDITALGRQEVWENSPEDYPQTPTYKSRN